MSQATEADSATATAELEGSDNHISADVSPLEALESEREQFLNTPLGEDVDSLGYQDEVDILKQLEEGGEAQPVTETQEEATEDVISEAKPVEQQEQPPEPTEESESAEQPEKVPQYRLRPRTDVGQEAFRLMKANPDMDEEDAFSLAKESLGVTPAPTPTQEPDPAPEPDPTFRASQEIKDDLQEAQKAVKEASDQLDDDALQAAQDKVNALFEELETSAQSQVSQQLEQSKKEQEVQEQIQTEFRQNEQKVIDAYGQDGSLSQSFLSRMQEIDNQWRDLGDPRADQANKPLILASMVAQEQGVAPNPTTSTPAKANETPPPTTPSAPEAKRQAAPSPPLHPASGSARATTGGTQTDLDSQLDSINDVEALERWRAQQGIAADVI